MAYKTEKNRPNKEKAREWLWEFDGQVKKFVTLPAEHAECIRAGIRYGKIRKSTEIIACEGKARLRGRVARRIAKVAPGRKFQLYGGRLSRMPLADMLDGEKVDIAFFDICGYWDFRLLKWLAGENGDVFAPGSKVAFTADLTKRQGPLLGALKEAGIAIDNSKFQTLLLGNDIGGKRCGGACGAKCLHVDPIEWAHGSGTQMVVRLLFYVLNSRYQVRLSRVYTYKDGDKGDPMAYIEFTVESRYRRNNTREMEILSNYIRKFVPEKQRGVAIEKGPAPWELLKCDRGHLTTAGQRAAAVRRAHNGQRPKWLTPAEWARNPENPANRVKPKRKYTKRQG